MIRPLPALRRCVRASTMNSRRLWFSATKSGSKVMATVRGRAKVTRLSSRMRPGRALITQMRLPRNAGLAQIVRHQQHGRLVGDPEILQDRPQLLARELVERAEGLVEQQHARLMDQRAAQIGALKHAAGELPGIACCQSP